MDTYKATYGKIAAIVLLILFSVTLWVVVLPYVTGVVEKVQLKNEFSERIAYSSNAEKDFEDLDQYKKGLEEGIQALQRNKSKEEQSYLIIDQLYKISETTYSEITSITPKEIQKEDRSVQTIELELIGRYHAIAEFINLLENSVFSVTIPEAQIRKQPSGNMLLAEITLQVHYSE